MSPYVKITMLALIAEGGILAMELFRFTDYK